jgi:tetratricopeptide (TPR) repeat protein
MVVYLSNYLMADYYFALGKGYRQINELQLAYENTQKAISLRREPNYLSQQAMLGANLAAIFTIQQNPIEAKRLSEEALSLGSEAISISPQNVTYLKDQAKTYYLLSLANLPERGNYFQKAVEALEKAAILAPTDPIIPYTLGALFSDIDAPRANRLLQSALKLRPNYTEANDLLQKLLAK